MQWLKLNLFEFIVFRASLVCQSVLIQYFGYNLNTVLKILYFLNSFVHCRHMIALPILCWICKITLLKTSINLVFKSFRSTMHVRYGVSENKKSPTPFASMRIPEVFRWSFKETSLMCWRLKLATVLAHPNDNVNVLTSILTFGKWHLPRILHR